MTVELKATIQGRRRVVGVGAGQLYKGLWKAFLEDRSFKSLL